MSVIILLAILLLPTLAFRGCVLCLSEVMKSSKHYQHFVMDLKRKDSFDLWIQEHHGQQLLDNIVRYQVLGIFGLVAYGFVLEFVPMPAWLHSVMLIAAFAFWPALWAVLSYLTSQRRRILADSHSGQ